MKKLFAILSVLFLASLAQASITQTLGEFSSPYWNGVPTEYTVGTFTYDLTGLEIVSATISGQWGNSTVPTTAPNHLWLDGIFLANTYQYFPSPTYTPFTSWSYTFDPSELWVLADGSASFSTFQISQTYVRVGETTLQIETRPVSANVPAPGAILLSGLGIGLVGKIKRKNLI